MSERKVSAAVFFGLFASALAWKGWPPSPERARALDLAGSLPAWFVLIAACAILGHAGVALLGLSFRGEARARRLRGERGAWAAWMLLAFAAVAVWPKAMSPDFFPLSSLLLFGVLIAWPAAAAERTAAGSLERQQVDRYIALIRTLGLLWLGYAVVTSALAARPLLEGVDFFYYALNARDMAAGATDIPQLYYYYFPGVYAFWRSAIQLGGPGLEPMQWAYLGVLVANAALVGAIVGRVGRRAAIAVWAGCWCFALCARFEGFYGVTEPLCTLPVLAALLVWGGEPLRGRPGRWWAAALGAGIGLGLFAKQQGGLLSLGFVALVLAHFATGPARRHDRVALALIPCVSVLVFLSAMLIEGDALAKLTYGTGVVNTYDSHGDLLNNLLKMARRSETLAIAALLAVGTWLALVLAPRLRPRLAEPWAGVAGFGAVAGLATLVPFWKRAYPHYALLPMPFFVVAGALCALHLLGGLRRELTASPAFRMLLMALLFVPFVYATPRYLAPVHVWPPHADPGPVQVLPWRTFPDIARDIAVLRSHVRPGEDMLVLPPRRNELHFVLGTRGIAYGYGWEINPPLMRRAIASPRLDAILTVSKPYLHPEDVDTWLAYDCDRLIAGLPGQGYRKAVELDTLTLWRRRQ